MAERERITDSTITAWIGIGSNLDDPRRQVVSAIASLGSYRPQLEVLWSSRLYGTAPVGGVRQPPFVNAVTRIATRLSPRALLDLLHQTEIAAGRRRSEEIFWGPRILDLDLLSYGDLQMSTPDLVLPHPRLHERAFVLIPLAEYDPHWQIPGRGAISDFLPKVQHQAVQVLTESPARREYPVLQPVLGNT